MSLRTISILALTTLALGLIAFRGVGPTPAEASEGGREPSRVERGKYLVTGIGCGDCHTPMKMGDKGPEPDMARMLSGHPSALQLPPAPTAAGPWGASFALTMTAWNGPWGTSFTANLTPDRETGLGAWTEEQFIKTIRTGRHLGSGRALLPPMPIPTYMNLSDEDLKSIFAYLRSVPAVKNRVPSPLPPAPVTTLWSSHT
jgi:mono/diheme cytochrome c family protein